MNYENIIKSLTKNKFSKETNINRNEVIELLNQIRYILFLGFYEDISSNTQEYITMKILLIKDLLNRQLNKAHNNNDTIREIIETFIAKLPEIKLKLEKDILAFINSDPAAESADEIILSYPGLYAISVYRIAHELYLLNVKQIPRIMTEYAHNRTGIDIHPGATIGEYFFIDHGTGIVIGETTEIGNNVKLYQGVTLGALSLHDASKLKGVKRHPTIRNNVTIYSGASILGGDTVIEDNVTIGCNVYITKSIDKNKTIIQRSNEVIEKNKRQE